MYTRTNIQYVCWLEEIIKNILTFSVIISKAMQQNVLP